MSPPGYGPDVRVDLCRQCGAALDAPAEGGRLTCSACGSENEVSARGLERVRLARLGVDPALDAAAQAAVRLEALQEQAEHYSASNPYATIEAPEGLEYLSEADAASPGLALQAQQSFLAALKRLDRGGDPLKERTVYWLARALERLIGRADPARARAALQAAEQALTDPGYKHLLRCSLADQACAADDPQGAAAWLALCDATPWLLEPDSAYRLSQAALAARRVSWDMVLERVGDPAGQFPCDPASVGRMRALRNEALEHLGRPPDAGDATEASRDVDANAADHQPRMPPALMAAYKEAAQAAQSAYREALAASEHDPSEETLPPPGFVGPPRPGGDSDHESAEDQEPAGPHWSALLVAIPLLALGTYLTVKRGAEVSKAAATNAWKPTRGMVIKASVEAETSGSGKDQTTDFYPSVKYTYEIDGKRFTGHRVTWMQTDSEYSSTAKAKAQLAKYPVGKAVTVYYNPEKPGEAVLKRGSGSGSLDYLLLGVAVVLVSLFLGVVWLYSLIRHARWRARQES
jgi:hypothetical protein